MRDSGRNVAQIWRARNHTALAFVTNLTATWLSLREAAGETRAAALRGLNSATGCAYTNSRLNEWLRGDRQPDRAARQAMLRDILPEMLTDLGVDPTDYTSLADKLT